MQKLNSPVCIRPDVGSLTRQLRRFCQKLQTLPSSSDRAPAELERIRAGANSTAGTATTEKLKLMLVCNVLIDLHLQGWTIKLERGCIHLFERMIESESLNDSKLRIRSQHLQERDAQLREPSVREFISSMERKRLTSKGWHSIFSVMRDGEELASSIRIASQETDPVKRGQLLDEIIEPYIQFVDTRSICTETGLKLGDIWRYFRHTWTTIYRSIPGRSMAILIRDRSRPGHPVIGIAALGSSVVQQAVRDRWIGWDKDSVVKDLCDSPTKKKVKRLLQNLNSQINDVYKADLIGDRLVTRWSIKRPTASDCERLMKESLKAIQSHRLYPSAADLKQVSPSRSNDWKKLAKTTLFRSKRCKHLATLLTIRRQFIDHDISHLSLSSLRVVMRRPSLRHAIAQLVRIIKADRVGINMMDITICGAVAPYNPILGGKLVCAMLCSPEVVLAYRQRYKNHISVIASCMAGKEVHRDPQLVLLATTSLYGAGSSQYNRLKLPVMQVIGGDSKESVGFIELGKSEGFGSFHFSKETIRVAHGLLGRLESGRKVNSIFGEGVNPLMRKMREALNIVRLPSEILLRHGNQRIIYGVPLAKNFREILLGMDSRPAYLVPLSDPAVKTKLLVKYWSRRWLSARIDKEEVLSSVSSHRLSYPIQHGARVILDTQSEAD